MTSQGVHIHAILSFEEYTLEALEQAYNVAAGLSKLAPTHGYLWLCQAPPHPHESDDLDEHGVCVWCRRRPDLG